MPGGSHDTVQTLTQQRTYGPNIVTCFNDPTIGSEADTAGLSWRFYTGSPRRNGGIWSAYQAIQPIYNSGDWGNDVIPSQSQFISDIGSGKLANITWITPTWSNSDHGGMDSTGGPPWVSSIVDAVGQSQFWNSSAIFVMWDDWGGFFDPVKPVTEDYDGLGFRVPLIDHLALCEEARRHPQAVRDGERPEVHRGQLGRGPLAAPTHAPTIRPPRRFNYSQSPRPFKNIQGAKPYRYWRQLEVEQAQPAAPRARGRRLTALVSSHKRGRGTHTKRGTRPSLRPRPPFTFAYRRCGQSSPMSIRIGSSPVTPPPPSIVA